MGIEAGRDSVTGVSKANTYWIKADAIDSSYAVAMLAIGLFSGEIY